MDTKTKDIQGLLFEQWKNGACMGYVIKAMEKLEFPSEDIHRVTSKMRELFDFMSLDEADAHYCNSPY